MSEDDLDLFKGSLPYRQLRKRVVNNPPISFSSLPYRQLRNDCAKWNDTTLSSLPYRQLRKMNN